MEKYYCRKAKSRKSAVGNGVLLQKVGNLPQNLEEYCRGKRGIRKIPRSKRQPQNTREISPGILVE